MPQRIAPPEQVLAMGLLDRVDYADAFAAPAPRGVAPAELAGTGVRALPGWLLGVVRFAHRRVLGLQLTESAPPAAVPGWRVLQEGPDRVVYGVDGGLVTPRLVVTTAAVPGQAVVVTLLRYDRPAAPVVWAVVGPVHRAIARWVVGRSASPAPAGDRTRRS